MRKQKSRKIQNKNCKKKNKKKSRKKKDEIWNEKCLPFSFLASDLNMTCLKVSQ